MGATESRDAFGHFDARIPEIVGKQLPVMVLHRIGGAQVNVAKGGTFVDEEAAFVAVEVARVVGKDEAGSESENVFGLFVPVGWNHRHEVGESGHTVKSVPPKVMNVLSKVHQYFYLVVGSFTTCT